VGAHWSSVGGRAGPELILGPTVRGGVSAGFELGPGSITAALPVDWSWDAIGAGTAGLEPLHQVAADVHQLALRLPEIAEAAAALAVVEVGAAVEVAGAIIDLHLDALEELQLRDRRDHRLLAPLAAAAAFDHRSTWPWTWVKIAASFTSRVVARRSARPVPIC